MDNLNFATNIKAPKNGNIKDYIIDFPIFLKNYRDEKRKLWKENLRKTMIEIAKEFLPFVKKQIHNKKLPKYLWHLYGLDIIFNNEFKPYLLEFNGKPGVIYDKVMPKHITSINRIMLDRIYERFIKLWLQERNNEHYLDKTITKLSTLNL